MVPPVQREFTWEARRGLDARARERTRQEHALEIVLRCFLAAVGGERGMLLGRGADGRILMLASENADRDSITPWTPGSFIDRAFRAGAPIVDEPVAAAGRFERGGTSAKAVAAPVLEGGETLGLIYAEFAAPSRLGEDQLCWLADSYARVAGLCRTESDGFAATIGASGFDQLTGCLDYTGLLQVLRAEVQRSERHDHRLSCCFLDLDGFKRVNDSVGHLEGNLVLAAVGRSLVDEARGHDAVGRFGGDEFVVVLPETGARAARRTAERLRAQLRKAIAEVTEHPVGVSVGVAEWTTGESPAKLLSHADDALREAKRLGGARVNANEPLDRRFDGILELTKDLMRRRDRDGDPDGSPLGPGGHRAGSEASGSPPQDGKRSRQVGAGEPGDQEGPSSEQRSGRIPGRATTGPERKGDCDGISDA